MLPRPLLSSLVVFAVIGPVATATPAAAQSGGASSAGSKLEIEVHAGGAFGTDPKGGSSQLPPPGESFAIPPNLTSRRVSSWFFGDGSALLNQVALMRPVIRPMVSLDPVLTKSAAERRGGSDFGFRINGVITSRFSAEFSLDSNLGHLAFVDTFLKGLEASRTGYTTTFSSLFTGTPPFGVFSSSDVTMHDDVGRQLLATGALNIELSSSRRFKPYLSVGAGVAVPRGDDPHVTLTGKLRLEGNLGSFSEETDTVTLRVVSQKTPVFLLGGGFKHDFSPRTGIRADVRLHVGKDHTRLLLDATPALTSGSATFSVLFLGNPALVLGRSFTAPNNLSGPPILDFETFKGTGTRTQANVSVGYFVRF